MERNQWKSCVSSSNMALSVLKQFKAFNLQTFQIHTEILQINSTSNSSGNSEATGCFE